MVRLEIAAGVARRDLPLFSCSYTLRMLRVIYASDVVRWEIGLHQCLVLFFFVFCWQMLEEVLAEEIVAVVEAVNAD